MSNGTHPVSEEQLVAYAEGEASDVVAAHLAGCSSCGRALADYTEADRRLRAGLLRFDCPSPLTLGEYALQLLSQAARVDIARHVLDCPTCATELRDARAYLATDPPASPVASSWQALQQRVAALFTPASGQALSFARGNADADRAGAEYHAGPIRVVIGSVPTRVRGTLTVDGLVVHDSAPSDVVGQRQVRLLLNDIPVQAARTDDLGGFTFDAIAAGTYRLEIALSDQVVVVENLPIGSPS